MKYWLIGDFQNKAEEWNDVLFRSAVKLNEDRGHSRGDVLYHIVIEAKIVKFWFYWLFCEINELANCFDEVLFYAVVQKSGKHFVGKQNVLVQAKKVDWTPFTQKFEDEHFGPSEFEVHTFETVSKKSYLSCYSGLVVPLVGVPKSFLNHNNDKSTSKLYRSDSHL